MVITVQLKVPDNDAADYLEKALRHWSEATLDWEFVFMSRVTDAAQKLCPECGKPMKYDEQLQTHVCVHIENDLPSG